MATASKRSSSLLKFCLLVNSQILLFLLVAASKSDDNPGEDILSPALAEEDSNRGFHIGDACLDGCSSVIENSYCSKATNTCQCLDTHPINIDGVTCVQPKNLYEPCTYNQQCSSRNEQGFCQELTSRQTQCSCRKGYHAEKAYEIPIRYECIPDSSGPLAETTVPAVVGLFIGLTILVFLFCFMFKLFTRSRWARTRAFADAGHPPPTITLEDEQIDLEKQHLCPTSSTGAIQTVKSSPGAAAAAAGHISGTNSSRRGSGNNNSEKGSLSNYNQSRRGSNRSSGGDSLGRRTSIQKNGAIITSDLAFNFNDVDCDIEQHITIIPNPRAKRRGSMADHAFPELHSSRVSKKEPDNLLILTRTKTDKHGRRHSVAVPLIPPPDGEKFEGGYHVERNPITGGAKLVPPPGGKVVRARSISERRGRERPHKSGNSTNNSSSTGNAGSKDQAKSSANSSDSSIKPQMDLLSTQFVISKTQKCAWLVNRSGSTRSQRPRTNLSMPTIGESSVMSASDALMVPTSRRPIRTRSCRLPVSSSTSTPVRYTMQPRSRSIGVEVPGGSGGSKRRHSYQAGVPGLSKDMDRLKVVQPGGSNSRGVSPRGSTKRRASSTRRSSRSGFLHFLDLAIAN